MLRNRDTTLFNKSQYKSLQFGTSLLLSAFFLWCLAACEDDPYSVPKIEGDFAVDVGSSQLPYIRVESESIQILKDRKIPAIMEIFQQGQLTEQYRIGIEFRGSSSYRMSDKKSYSVETWDFQGEDTDESILGFPEEEDWILMGHVFRASNNTVFDPTLMHHFIAYEWSRAIGRYASRTKWVELEVNGDYKGVYVFMEKLKRETTRINITQLEPFENQEPEISGGYILKIDKTTGDVDLGNRPLSYYENNWEDDARYNEQIAFRSAFDVFGGRINFPAYQPPYHAQQYLETYFLYEEPDAARISSAQKNYIQQYINGFESALVASKESGQAEYQDYIDLESFVDFFILNELCGNVDAYRISTYLQKDRNEKLKMGPIWDMNIGYNRQDRVPFTDWMVNYNDYIGQDAWMVPFWWDILLEDAIFTTALKTRWQALRQNTLTDVYLATSIQEQSSYLQSNGAVRRNYARWSGVGVNYDQSIEDLTAWVLERARWMDGEIGSY